MLALVASAAMAATTISDARVQDFRVHPDARFRLYRIGDAVASRDIHAVIFDALRLCKDF
jgi:hypothetical protein